MSRHPLALAAAALFAGAALGSPLVAQAKPAAPTAKPQAKSTDSVHVDAAFIREAAADNVLEVRLGELAQKRSSNADVKQFGQRMVTDHNNLQNDLVAKAKQGGMVFTTGLGAKHEEKLERLQKAPAKSFDRDYMTEMVLSHREDVDYFQREGRAAHTSLIRSHVEKALPLLQAHLTEATRIAQKIGVDTATIARTHHVASADKDDKSSASSSKSSSKTTEKTPYK